MLIAIRFLHIPYLILERKNGAVLHYFPFSRYTNTFNEVVITVTLVEQRVGYLKLLTRDFWIVKNQVSGERKKKRNVWLADSYIFFGPIHSTVPGRAMFLHSQLTSMQFPQWTRHGRRCQANEP